MCKWGTEQKIWIKIPADLSSTGEIKWRYMQIDSCIATLVEALQQGGIDMRASCCRHDEGLGHIYLQDGRMLLILSKPDAELFYYRRVFFHTKILYKAVKVEIANILKHIW